MSDARRRAGRVRASPGFTLIEMLTVIGILLLIMALALPNFVAMMKGRKWATAVNTIQHMVWRARALATNVRKDMSVEFDINADNGTWMWVESEVQVLERVPDLDLVQQTIASGEGYNMYPGSAIDWLVNLWKNSGGTCEWKDGYYINFQLNAANTSSGRYGDNARQSEEVELGSGMTIDTDPQKSPHFINWDAPGSVAWKGDDPYRDIRIGPNGALVQTIDPTLCITRKDSGEHKQVRVVRCTGRLVSVR